MAHGPEQVFEEPARHAALPPPVRSLNDLVTTAILALFFGMVGSSVSLRFFGDSPRAAVADRERDLPGGSVEAGVAPEPLTDQIGRLSDRVNGVSKRLDDLPGPATPPDLADLQDRVAEVARVTRGLAPIRRAIAEIDSRIDDTSQVLRSVRNEVQAISKPPGPDRVR